MAGQNDIKVTKSMKWPEVAARVASDCSMPKKQIDETMGAVAETLSKIIEETRPQKIGTATLIHTPIGAIQVTKIPSEVRVDIASGKNVERDECFAVKMGTPREFINAANVGVVLEKNEKPEKSEKKKSA
jgi:hypothetical protein